MARVYWADQYWVESFSLLKMGRVRLAVGRFPCEGSINSLQAMGENDGQIERLIDRYDVFACTKAHRKVRLV